MTDEPKRTFDRVHSDTDNIIHGTRRVDSEGKSAVVELLNRTVQVHREALARNGNKLKL